MENPEEVLQTLDEFTKLKPKDIPKELEDYLSYVAKTGDPVYQWSLVKSLFREKLLNVITDFYEGCPSVDLPPCPNVDTFNYETMKDRLIERLELFASAPFTVQRLCELLTSPKKQYSRADKFMRAVEKNIMVVSTREPGQLRRNDSSQPELVNGVVETTGVENEPSRVSLGLTETVGSSATSTTSFLNNEGSVQVIFEDSSLDKNHSPTKSYEETYEDGVPRRASGWFRERVETPDKLSPFSSQIHSHVSTRISEESDVDVGNQLAEKYHGPVVDRGIVEEDDDDIDDDYVEPTRNVAHFHSRESNPTLLGLESADDYCGPPSPEEENSETSVAVSTIAEETSNTIPDTSILEAGEPLQKETSLASESSKDSLISSLSNSETSDIKTDLKLKPESPSLEITNNVEEEKVQDSITIELINESTNPVSTICSETLTIDSKSEKAPSNDSKTTTAVAELETDNMEVNITMTSSDTETVSIEAVAFESSKDETKSSDEIPASKSKSPEPTVVEPCEPETTVTDGIAKESTESTVDADSTLKIVECDSVKESEPIEAETIEMSILDSLGPITPEDSSDVAVPEVPVLEEVGLPASEPVSVTSTDPPLDEPTEKTGTEDEAATKPESPVRVSEHLKPETATVAEETPESVPSVEEERDREMMIQNERVESVIQENLEQTPLQEEILVQQIFVPHEVPMDEKTSECEPEAMEVDENSQTVEEPMEQGDNSPTIS